VLVFVPYLGSITGFLLATLAAVMQFQAMPGVLAVWAVFAVGQLLEGMVVTPLLVGDRIGLHPVAVIFALLAFGQLFGFSASCLRFPPVPRFSSHCGIWAKTIEAAQPSSDRDGDETGLGRCESGFLTARNIYSREHDSA